MPEITEIIGVDEKYTIVAEVASSKATGPISSGQDLLAGAAIGRTSVNVENTPRVVTKYIKSKPIVIQPKTIIVNRYLRDNSKLLKAVEALNNPRALIDAMVAGNTLQPDEYNVRKIPGTEILESPRAAEARYLEEKYGGQLVAKLKPKKVLGVQRATVFTSEEQISVDRMIQRQKKELRSDLKAEVIKNDSISKRGKLLEISRMQKDTQITETYRALEKSNRDFMALKSSIQTQYISLIKHNSIISKYQNQIIRLKKIASGMETFMDEGSPDGGRNQLARSRERMQNKIIREKEIAFSQRRAQTELTFEQKFAQATGTTGREMIKPTPIEPLFQKPDRGQQLFNRMSMKGRR